MKSESKTKFDAYRTRQFHINQRELLQQLTVEKLAIGRDGGLFTITPTLMNFVDLVLRSGVNASVLTDNHNIPILVMDLQAFMDDMTDQYFAVMTDVYNKHQHIQQDLDDVKELVIDD
jgi:hypothetical protein